MSALTEFTVPAAEFILHETLEAFLTFASR